LEVFAEGFGREVLTDGLGLTCALDEGVGVALGV
jgi:hypothetical protein